MYLCPQISLVFSCKTTFTLQADAISQGIYLISSNVVNTTFYNSYGFLSVAQFTLGEDNPTWQEKPVEIHLVSPSTCIFYTFAQLHILSFIDGEEAELEWLKTSASTVSVSRNGTGTQHLCVFVNRMLQRVMINDSTYKDHKHRFYSST